jgi:hypothetical protein
MPRNHAVNAAFNSGTPSITGNLVGGRDNSIGRRIVIRFDLKKQVVKTMSIVWREPLILEECVTSIFRVRRVRNIVIKPHVEDLV